MKVAKFIGADGEQGITVYKSIHRKVFNTIKYMLDNDVYNIMFTIKFQFDTYIIHRYARMFRIKKVNHKGKVFIYQIKTAYRDYDNSDSIEFILPKKLDDVDKYKMRMFTNTEYENYISMMS